MRQLYASAITGGLCRATLSPLPPDLYRHRRLIYTKFQTTTVNCEKIKIQFEKNI